MAATTNARLTELMAQVQANHLRNALWKNVSVERSGNVEDGWIVSADAPAGDYTINIELVGTPDEEEEPCQSSE